MIPTRSTFLLHLIKVFRNPTSTLLFRQYTFSAFLMIKITIFAVITRAYIWAIPTMFWTILTLIWLLIKIFPTPTWKTSCFITIIAKFYLTLITFPCFEIKILSITIANTALSRNILVWLWKIAFCYAFPIIRIEIVMWIPTIFTRLRYIIKILAYIIANTIFIPFVVISIFRASWHTLI